MFKVLIVDDDKYIRRIAEVSLTKVGGWQVSLAESGLECLQSIAQEKPDVILLDIMMPIMDGPTTLQQIRQTSTGKDIPIIFMTAKVQQKEVERYLQMDAAGLIRKPFDPILLSGEIIVILATLSKTTIQAREPAFDGVGNKRIATVPAIR